VTTPGEKGTTLNLVMISLDTLRADVAYSGRFNSIERLRSQGCSFMTTVSSSPLTPISHATVFTGLQPPNHGVRHLLKEQMHPGARTIAERLAEAGYTTGAVVSCPGMNRWYGLDKGFAHYDDWIPPLADGRDALKVVDVELRGTALKRAPLVVERALEWVRSAGPGPKLLLAHFFDAHWPYEPPEEPSIALPNPYEGEVWYMDRYLGLLLDGLAELGMTHENTMFVLFSDHGEDLAGWYPNDHAGSLGHPEEKGHGCLLFDATQLVPLVICAPSVSTPGTMIKEQVRLVDVAPTILEFLGCDNTGCDGRSLAPFLRGEQMPHTAAYCEAFYREELASTSPQWSHLLPLKGIRNPDEKIVWEVGGDRVETYDMLQDPCEHNPIVLVP
jgi:arylsulfatase